MVDASIRRPVTIAMLFLGTTILGVISVYHLPVELFPELSYPTLTIITTYKNAPPLVIEKEITTKIEEVCTGIRGVKNIRSTSKEGLSIVQIEFDWGENMEYAFLHTREKLDKLYPYLPEGTSRPTIKRFDPNEEPIQTIAVTSAQVISEQQLYIIKRRLEQIKGVGEANFLGEQEQEIKVRVNPSMLEVYNLTIEDVKNSLIEANYSVPGGVIKKGMYKFPLRIRVGWQTIADVGNTIIAKTENGNLLRLKDIAEIEESPKAKNNFIRLDGAASVSVSIYKESGTNTVAVAQKVRKVLNELEQRFGSIKFHIVDDQSKFIKSAITNVISAIILGGIFAFFVLFLFLRDFKSISSIAISIPISIITTFMFLYFTKVTINMMTLGGLALGIGMLVDASIVVLESIHKHKERGFSPIESASRGTKLVLLAIVVSTLTTIAVFFPIVYAHGITGKMFGPLSITVSICLLTSLFVSFTLLPSIQSRIKISVTKSPKFMERFQTYYERSLHSVLGNRKKAIGLTLLFFMLSILLFFAMNRELFPKLKTKEYELLVRMPEGTPLNITNEITSKLESLLNPYAEHIFTVVGEEAVVFGRRPAPNVATIRVKLKDIRYKDDIIEKLNHIDVGAPNITFTRTKTVLENLLTTLRTGILIKVIGEDIEFSRMIATTVRDAIKNIKGIRNAKLDVKEPYHQIEVIILHDKCNEFGLSPKEVGDNLRAIMEGVRLTKLFTGTSREDVHILVNTDATDMLEAAMNYELNGIPLSELVEVKRVLAPSEIIRENSERVITVRADYVGSLRSALSRVASVLTGKSVNGARIEVSGENVEFMKSLRSLVFIFMVAVLLVYMIMAAAFESLLYPFIILFEVPLSLIGVAFLLFLTRTSLNAISLIGIIVLIGIVVNDGIVLVDCINRYRRKGLNVRESVLQGASERFRPILMTSATTILGLLPLALSVNTIGSPLGIAVIGGLLSSTLLTLFIIPILYETFSRSK